MGKYRIEVTGLSELGPTVEVNRLFHRLYGAPQECGVPNPYVAKYRRFRARASPRLKDSQNYNHTTGIIDYRYWPDLKLAYIEDAHVISNMRHKGLGVRLMNFAVTYLRQLGSQYIYAFSVNPEGFRLLANAGFVEEKPENLANPWRRWFTIT
jgi:GNAT superfamily N-acetyltransferase